MLNDTKLSSKEYIIIAIKQITKISIYPERADLKSKLWFERDTSLLRNSADRFIPDDAVKNKTGINKMH